VRRRARTADLPPWVTRAQARHWLLPAEMVGDVVHMRVRALHLFVDALQEVDLWDRATGVWRWPAFPDFGEYDPSVPPPPAALVAQVRGERPDRLPAA
jgi:hypothetical protein